VVIGLGKLVVGDLAGFFHEPAMSDDHTTAVVERSMIALAGDAPPKRRLNRGLRRLSEPLTDPRPGAKPPGSIEVQTART
jgi:hypothetical protein